MKMNGAIAGCLLAVALVAMVGCEKMKPTEETVQPAPTIAAPKEAPPAEAAPTTPGTMATIVVGQASFNVWIAESDEDRAKGLMKRESLPENQGMWFVFPVSENYSFWMKDTLIPLDWIFVDVDGSGQMKVVDIKADNKPKDETLYAPKAPFRYALEINAGQAAKLGLKVGDAVQVRIGAK